MSTNNEYIVSFTPFSERHYIKNFKKKYKNAWDKTRISIEESFKLFDLLLERKTAEIIIDRQDITICKTEFRVAGTNQSRHGSGNRCIVAIHNKIKRVNVLLVYHKSHLTGSGNETGKWKKLIKRNYQEYTDLL